MLTSRFILIKFDRNTLMALFTPTASKIADTQAQIARLREQVEALGRDRVMPAVADFSGRAKTTLRSAKGVMSDQAQVVSSRVKEQPLIAIVIAAAVGWVLGRVTR
jgi:hypothetical protein